MVGPRGAQTETAVTLAICSLRNKGMSGERPPGGFCSASRGGWGCGWHTGRLGRGTELGPGEAAEGHGQGSRRQEPGEGRTRKCGVPGSVADTRARGPALALSPSGCGIRCFGNKNWRSKEMSKKGLSESEEEKEKK